MPASKAEQVLAVLEALLETVSGAVTERNRVLPEKVPDGGLIILRIRGSTPCQDFALRCAGNWTGLIDPGPTGACGFAAHIPDAPRGASPRVRGGSSASSEMGASAVARSRSEGCGVGQERRPTPAVHPDTGAILRPR